MENIHLASILTLLLLLVFGGSTDAQSVTCPRLPSPLNGRVIISGGTRAIYSCNVGYILRGSSIRTCIGGRWLGSQPSCVRNTCPRLISPLNGRVTITGITARYSCNPGYILRGSSTRTCIGGRWSGSQPSCVRGSTTCPRPPNPLNGRVTVTGTTARYSCNPGYTLRGLTIRFCSRGTWSGSQPQCVRGSTTCPRLLNPLNGRVTVTGTTARYSCNFGYTLRGSTIRFCSRGIWSGSQPQCVRSSTCPRLLNPPNGRVTIFGTTARYSCNFGYILRGSSTRTCFGGRWFGSQPSCVRRIIG